MVSSEITTGEWCIDGGFTPPHHAISRRGVQGGGGGSYQHQGLFFPFPEWRFGMDFVWSMSVDSFLLPTYVKPPIYILLTSLHVA